MFWDFTNPPNPTITHGDSGVEPFNNDLINEDSFLFLYEFNEVLFFRDRLINLRSFAGRTSKVMTDLLGW
ncbi:MAG TPA: hypothetical protein V6D29_11990 [Leptolyngbyaceae cyanobacterium]